MTQQGRDPLAQGIATTPLNAVPSSSEPEAEFDNGTKTARELHVALSFANIVQRALPINEEIDQLAERALSKRMAGKPFRKLGEFITQYDEYLDGDRSYEDLPAFTPYDQRDERDEDGDEVRPVSAPLCRPTRTGTTEIGADAETGLADLGPCPFCGLVIKADPDHFIVSHELPTCGKFDQMDALTFITAVRRRREAADSPSATSTPSKIPRAKA